MVATKFLRRQNQTNLMVADTVIAKVVEQAGDPTEDIRTRIEMVLFIKQWGHKYKIQDGDAALLRVRHILVWDKIMDRHIPVWDKIMDAQDESYIYI